MGRGIRLTFSTQLSWFIFWTELSGIRVFRVGFFFLHYNASFSLIFKYF